MSYIRKIPRVSTKIFPLVRHVDEEDLIFSRKLDLEIQQMQKEQEQKESIKKEININKINQITQLHIDKVNTVSNKQIEKVEKIKVEIPNLKFPLKEHQHQAVKWMLDIETKVKKDPNSYNIRGGILSDAPGLGKTLSTLSLCIKKSIDEPEGETGFPNLVICPKIVIDEWCNAITKFFGNTYKFIAFKSNKTIDIKLEEIKKYKFVITNYEYVNGLMKEFYETTLEENKKNKEFELRKEIDEKYLVNKKGRELLVDINWNRIICDESHRLNNSKSLTFLSLMNLISDKRWCLTGTPIRNCEKDIYHQFLFLGYNNFIGNKRFTYNQYRSDKLHKHILKRNYSDVNIEMPVFEEKFITIELTENEKELYNNVNDFLKKTYKQFSNGYASFSNVLHLFLRLRQMCVSSYAMIRQLEKLNKKSKKDIKIIDENDIDILKEMSIEDIDKNDIIHLSNIVSEIIPEKLNEWVKDKYGSAGYMSSKIQSILNILNEIDSNEKVLIYTCFKTHMDIIKEAIENKFNKKVSILNGDFNEKQRQDILSSFKGTGEIQSENECNIMIINYKLGSEGLNLMEANNVILCENWWCPSVMEQAKHRAYRIGQKRKVKIYNIITKNTIEEKIKKICDKKDEIGKSFMNDIFDCFKQKDYGLNSTTLKRIIF
jgi:SNF2 family DNA or RNA helicase